jgi:transposase InsO family protein
MSCSPSWGRKNRLYLMTLVDRHTSCILAWRVAAEREEALLQAMVDEAPQAKVYYSDLFATYRKLVYTPGRHTPMPDKSETYRAVKLFVFAWNRRQIYHQRFPAYPAYVMDFVCP